MDDLLELREVSARMSEMGTNISITHTKTGLLGLASNNGVAMVIWDGVPDAQCALDAGKWLRKNREDSPKGSAFLSIMAPMVQLPGKEVQDIIQANINPNIQASDAVAIVILGNGLKTSAVRAFLATTLFVLNRTAVLKGQPPKTFATVADATAWIKGVLAQKNVDVDTQSVQQQFQQLQENMNRSRMSVPPEIASA